MASSIKHTLAWAGYKFASTVLDDIWPQALFFTGIATMVACVSKFTTTNLGINSITLTVLGTVVSLVVSFKTNNSYLRWWEGRNVWTNITTNSRQLAMLIWLQVPNRPKPKDDDAKEKGTAAPESKEAIGPNDRESRRLSASSAGLKDDLTAKWHDENARDNDDPAAEPLLGRSDEASSSRRKNSRTFSDQASIKQQEDTEKELSKHIQEREELEGLIEKKTYIGLGADARIQAFAVAMKHSLRGERGPFYSDLYSLIAFLPKFNPSAFPPITRDHLLVLWQNGIPRQKVYKSDDVMAVPLSQPASYDGTAFDFLDSSEKQTGPSAGPTDKESNPSGLTTSSAAFKEQSIRAAAKFVETDDPDVIGFASLNRSNHRLCRDNTPPRETEKVTIASVELMPPRHPPTARYWDFFPPLRIVKIVIDWFKTQIRLDDQERTKGGKRRRGTNAVHSAIPQEILLYLSSYINELAERGSVNSSFLSPLVASVLELQKGISDLEKIATTPIPSAYSFHLRLTVWAYLFFLPFQLYNYVGWLTIPATAVASVTYLGFLEIGAQIEQPFGYEQSDLDLDKFVLKIAQQLAEVTAFPTGISSRHIVLSNLNQPFLPSVSLSATELLGAPETQTTPTTLGFAAAYPEEDASAKNHSAATLHRPLPKTIRDIEMALNANWREIGDETKKVLGRQRDQLENKTGMEVAVLAL